MILYLRYHVVRTGGFVFWGAEFPAEDAYPDAEAVKVFNITTQETQHVLSCSIKAQHAVC